MSCDAAVYGNDVTHTLADAGVGRYILTVGRRPSSNKTFVHMQRLGMKHLNGNACFFGRSFRYK